MFQCVLLTLPTAPPCVNSQVLVLGLMGFLAYMTAATLDLSAIIAVFFCGITMSHYTWHSLSPAAQSLGLHSFRVVSSLMEMILYCYSGIDIWSTAMWQGGVYQSERMKKVSSNAICSAVALSCMWVACQTHYSSLHALHR